MSSNAFWGYDARHVSNQGIITSPVYLLSDSSYDFTVIQRFSSAERNAAAGHPIILTVLQYLSQKLFLVVFSPHHLPGVRITLPDAHTALPALALVRNKSVTFHVAYGFFRTQNTASCTVDADICLNQNLGPPLSGIRGLHTICSAGNSPLKIQRCVYRGHPQLQTVLY